MATQKNEGQEYQIFGREFWHKIGVCVYSFLFVKKMIEPGYFQVEQSIHIYLSNLVSSPNSKVPSPQFSHIFLFITKSG